MDLLTRQRKGMIFWDIWAEILLKAAEKYNVNIPSFVTLKEEQELFIEKLLQDKEFLKNLQNQQQKTQKAPVIKYQQRKTWENCDAFSPLSSTGGESADGECAQARVFSSRRRILWLEPSPDSSRLRLKTLVRQIHAGFVFEPPADSAAHELPRQR